jgi:hypothetical protein
MNMASTEPSTVINRATNFSRRQSTALMWKPRRAAVEEPRGIDNHDRSASPPSCSTVPEDRRGRPGRFEASELAHDRLRSFAGAALSRPGSAFCRSDRVDEHQ